MIINFVGLFGISGSGEVSDETHLARELESLGHVVRRIPRDEWREYVLEYPNGKYKGVPEDLKADINLIAKWHHFYDERFIKTLKDLSNAPVFYWVWDNMEGHTPDDWHIKMAKESDLYLSGELGLASWYKMNKVPFYYFQFDSCDGEFPAMSSSKSDKQYDVVFLGSCTNQNGRLDILKEINKQIPIQVFGPDYEEWRKQGFKAEPAVYELEFNRIVAKSKIILGTSANVNIFGYWSNRVGKVLHAGGFLLQWYTPGMELFLADCAEYFSTVEEAVEKIKYYLANPDKIVPFWENNVYLGRERWTSAYKVRQLSVLMDRYVKTKGEGWMLP